MSIEKVRNHFKRTGMEYRIQEFDVAYAGRGAGAGWAYGGRSLPFCGE